MSCLNLKTLSNYKDKPSLLFFSSGLGAGGAEAMLLRIAKHFKKNDCNVFIINLTKQNTLEEKLNLKMRRGHRREILDIGKNQLDF